MYLDDPHAVVRPFVPKPPPKLDPRLLAFAQEGHGAGRGHTVGKPERAHLPANVCHYVNGRHACYQFRDYCPVDGSRDEYLSQGADQPIAFRPMTPRPQ